MRILRSRVAVAGAVVLADEVGVGSEVWPAGQLCCTQWKLSELLFFVLAIGNLAGS